MISNDTITKVVAAVNDHPGNYKPSVILGIVEKESNGIFFWKVNYRDVPIFRPESHWFYKYLSGKERTDAVKQELASAKAGAIKVPSNSASRKVILDRMVAINEEAAYMSISMGVGQVMGFHYKKLGFKSAKAMWQHCHTIEGQIDVMLRFIELTPALVIAIRDLDYPNIGRYYNGPAYKKNNYDVDVKRYRNRYANYDRGVPVVDTQSVVVKSSWQARIYALGFSDVREFQTQYGLNPDGVIGDMTKDAVTDVEKRTKQELQRPESAASTVGIAGVATAGLGGLVSNPDLAVATLRPILDAGAVFAGYSADVLLFGGAVIAIVAGVAWFTKRQKRKAALADRERRAERVDTIRELEAAD